MKGDDKPRGWVSPDAVGPGLKVDEQGRIVLNIKPGTALRVNEQGQIESAADVAPPTQRSG